MKDTWFITQAYGNRALIPAREAMTEDTIFDAASLTKVIATTSCVMRLVERGKLRIDDPVVRYLPEFEGGKSDITIRNLMSHFSGLRPRSGSEAKVVRLRNRHLSRAQRKAHHPSGHALRILRYQLHPSGRDRPPPQWQNSRRVCAPGNLLAARNGRDHVSAAVVVEAAYCPN